MKIFSTKNIATFFLVLIIPWNLLLFMPSKAYAQDTGQGGDTSEIAPPGSEDTEMAMDDGIDPSIAANYNPDTDPVYQIASILDGLDLRRNASGDGTERGLPRITMSSCDMQLVKSGEIDGRLIEALNYLVRPATSAQGGGGITYLNVTFNKQCEESVPEIVGGGYPVVFDDFPTSSVTRPTAANLPSSSSTNQLTYPITPVNKFPTVTSIIRDEAYTSQPQNTASNGIANIIAPVAKAASNDSTSGIEPEGASDVHERGQAVDITAAGLTMCKTKSGGIFGGIGSSTKWQPARPIKVSWQTDAGVANVQTPYGNTFDQMANSAALEQFLAGFAATDGTYQANALKGVFTMIGFNALANLLGIKPGTFDPNTASLNYSTLGYALLADMMGLPDASVFNPFLGAGDDVTNPYASGHDNLNKLLHNSALRTIEKDLKLQSGSLSGDSIEEVLTNTAARRLEKDMMLSPGSLRIDLNNPTAILQTIGQAKLESSLRLPIGSANMSSANNGQSPIEALITNITKSFGLESGQTKYAETIVRGALNMPTSISLADILNKNSNFWNNAGTNQTFSDYLNGFDTQLLPTTTQNIFPAGIFPEADTIASRGAQNLTARLIKSELSLVDYEKIIGLGALLTQYGVFGDANVATNNGSMFNGGTTSSNGAAFDFPQDRTSYALTGGITELIADNMTIEEYRRTKKDPLAQIYTVTSSNGFGSSTYTASDFNGEDYVVTDTTASRNTRKYGKYGTDNSPLIKVSLEGGKTLDQIKVSSHDQNAIIVNPPKNEFLTRIVKGDKKFWMALGANVITKALHLDPDERLKVSVDAGGIESRSGIVQNILNGTMVGGKYDLKLTGAKVSLTLNLSPDQLIMALGGSLSQSKSGSGSGDAGKRAEERFNALISIAKDKLGYTFDNVTARAIGDPVMLNLLYSYDKTRETTTKAVEKFTIYDTETTSTSFVLSNTPTNVGKVSLTSYGSETPFDVAYSVGQDRKTIYLEQKSLDAIAAQAPLEGSTVTVEYTMTNVKAGNAASISPGLFTSLLNNPQSITNLALQFGASKASVAMNMAPNALSMAAGLLDPTNKSGIKGVGQATLEAAAGVAPGMLKGSLEDAIKNGMTVAQIERMLRLESGWYAKIKANDASFMNQYGVYLFDTDDYYHVPLGSTQDLIQGKIDLDKYKQMMGEMQLKYNMGMIFASQFNIHVSDYRLTAADFAAILEGNYFDVLSRIGARLQEKSHGLPIGALATALLTGANNVSLFSLGANLIASAFHLDSINLMGANSIADVQTEIGRSTIDKALGFKQKITTTKNILVPSSEGLFRGDDILAVAKNIGAEQFVTAFGITLPNQVIDQLKSIDSKYHAELIQDQRDDIIYTYLASIIGPGIGAEAHFSEITLKRFETIDRTLGLIGVDAGATLKLMQYTLSVAEYTSKVSAVAVTTGIMTDLGHIFGLPDSYAFLGSRIVEAVRKNDMVGLRNVAGEFGGTYVDAAVGWNKGTFAALVRDINNPKQFRSLLAKQGSAALAKFLGIENSDYFNSLFTGNLTAFGTERLSDYLNKSDGLNLKMPYSDVAQLLNGHYVQGFELIGVALMAKQDDMKSAGITYAELRASLFGDNNILSLGFTQYIVENYPEYTSNPSAYLSDMDSDTIFTDYEVYNRKSMTEARQNISYKYMDYQAKKLMPGIDIPPGFARALLGGKFNYTDPATGLTTVLTGDAARWQMGKTFLVNYIGKDIRLLDGIRNTPFYSVLTDYLVPGGPHSFDEKWLENELTANNGAGMKAVGSVLDSIAGKAFGINIQSGTGAALVGYAVNGNLSQLGNSLWQAWQGYAFNWADKFLGLQGGSSGAIYQSVVTYQKALSVYSSSISKAGVMASEAAKLKAAGNLTSAKAMSDSASKLKSSASIKIRTQQAMLIAAVAGIVFQKQIGQIETALGLAPGSLMYLIQYLIHPDPISLGLFIFFNFVWGKSKTTCGIDHYPGDTSFNPAAQFLSDAITQSLYTDNVTVSSTELTDSKKSGTNPINAKLAMPKNFDGQNNDSYRKGIKAGAQYEVRLVIGSLIMMNRVTASVGHEIPLPTQIGTYSQSDINMYESISSQPSVYGTLESRGKRGPGFYDKMTDRIHLGY